MVYGSISKKQAYENFILTSFSKAFNFVSVELSFCNKVWNTRNTRNKDRKHQSPMKTKKFLPKSNNIARYKALWLGFLSLHQRHDWIFLPLLEKLKVRLTDISLIFYARRSYNDCLAWPPEFSVTAITEVLIQITSPTTLHVNPFSPRARHVSSKNKILSDR